MLRGSVMIILQLVDLRAQLVLLVGNVITSVLVVFAKLFSISLNQLDLMRKTKNVIETDQQISDLNTHPGDKIFQIKGSQNVQAS